ncbi:t1pks [Epichloe bromicola]
MRQHTKALHSAALVEASFCETIFTVSTKDKWTEHCRGLIQAVPGDTIKQAKDMCYKADWVDYMETWNSNRRSSSVGNIPSPVSGTASQQQQQQQQHLDGVAAEYAQKALPELEPGGIGDAYKQLASRQMLLSKLERAGLVADTTSENSVAAEERSSAVLTASRPRVSDTPAVPPVQLVSTGSMAMTYTEAGLGRIEAALREVRTPVCDLAQVSPGDNFVVILPEVTEKLCLNAKDNDWQRFRLG